VARILIVEDEEEMAEILRQALTDEGYCCTIASNGKIGLTKGLDCDLALVDVMMPVMTGFVMVQRMREQGLQIPVIYLTAKDATRDLVYGLEGGGDDYLIKPFALDELLARIKAQLRRARLSTHVLQWEDVTIDCLKRTAFLGHHELFLSGTEFSLLEFFLRHPDEILSKASILKHVWHDEGYRDDNIVETYVAYLRRKIERHGKKRIIHTVRGRGYVLAMDELEPPT